MEGIVFNVPEEWQIEDISEGNLYYKDPNSRLSFSGYTIDEDYIKDLPEDRKVESIEQFFEKYMKGTKKDQKKNNYDQEEIKICDTDGVYNKHKIKDSSDYYALSAAWVMDNIIYSLNYVNAEAYGDQGQLKDDIEPLTDDEIAVFESVLASVRPGDGKAILDESIKSGGIGKLSYEMPEGYSSDFVSDRHISFKKDGSDVSIQINVTKEDDLAELSEMSEEKYESLDDYYNIGEISDEDKTTIAGLDGDKQMYPDEDGKYYNVSARFRDNDAVYGVYMDSNAYDENGNLKDDAEALTDEDIATFDAFLASLKKK